MVTFASNAIVVVTFKSLLQFYIVEHAGKKMACFSLGIRLGGITTCDISHHVSFLLNQNGEVVCKKTACNDSAAYKNTFKSNNFSCSQNDRSKFRLLV